MPFASWPHAMLDACVSSGAGPCAVIAKYEQSSGAATGRMVGWRRADSSGQPGNAVTGDRDVRHLARQLRQAQPGRTPCCRTGQSYRSRRWTDLEKMKSNVRVTQTSTAERLGAPAPHHGGVVSPSCTGYSGKRSRHRSARAGVRRSTDIASRPDGTPADRSGRCGNR